MSPIADADHLRVLAAAPNQDRIPPRLFRFLADIAGLKRRFRIGGLNGRLKVRYRRECFLYPGAAGA
jgi:hypothetical protein